MESKKNVNDMTTKEYLVYLRENWNHPEVNELPNGMVEEVDSTIVRMANVFINSLPDQTKNSIKSNVEFGILYSREINGLCIKAPSGGCVVMVSGALVAYSSVLAKMLGATITFSSSDRDSKSGLSYDEAAIAIHSLLSIFPRFPDQFGLMYAEKWFTLIDPAYNHERASDTDYRTMFSSFLSDSVVYFVLLHEIGHFVLNHVDRCPLKEMAIQGGSVQVVSPQWEQEYEADRFGCQVLDQYASTEMKENMIYRLAAQVAPAVFFMTLHLIEEVLGDSPSVSHPPSSYRLDNIKKVIEIDDQSELVLSVFEKEILAKTLRYFD